ncbi:hypothetical protein AB870_23965 (plasmid) [Pandoraea faecigallinarum]|uniref:Uncharacterized protein n=1 Tax=Pandoraea faecigallinarum TaxID=656179 RepID=A0A0H3WZW0_9BURK|nr:hypothetical protein [Pandoraea faecigallinarum]AKM33267.3 hypothetical protein AB870_23965 [Pandoraea faecigallinarum]
MGLEVGASSSISAANVTGVRLVDGLGLRVTAAIDTKMVELQNSLRDLNNALEAPSFNGIGRNELQDCKKKLDQLGTNFFDPPTGRTALALLTRTASELDRLGHEIANEPESDRKWEWLTHVAVALALTFSLVAVAAIIVATVGGSGAPALVSWLATMERIAHFNSRSSRAQERAAQGTRLPDEIARPLKPIADSLNRVKTQVYRLEGTAMIDRVGVGLDARARDYLATQLESAGADPLTEGAADRVLHRDYIDSDIVRSLIHALWRGELTFRAEHVETGLQHLGVVLALAAAAPQDMNTKVRAAWQELMPCLERREGIAKPSGAHASPAVGQQPRPHTALPPYPHGAPLA